MTDEIFTLKEVATYLKIGERTVYRLVQEGKLPGFKVGGSWRFKRTDIEEWIRERTEAQREVAADGGGSLMSPAHISAFLQHLQAAGSTRCSI